MKTKLIIALLVIIIIFAVRMSGVGDALTLDNVKDQRDSIQLFAQENLILTATLFVLIYIAVVALSVPGATILTLTSGFLFGAIAGTLLTNLGATTGAVILFLLARYVLGDWVQKRYVKRLQSFNKEFDKNGKNYLLTLRLIPLFPFFLVNLFAGLTKVPLSTYVWTTAIGIIPGSFVYAYAGKQLGSISSLSDIFTTQILIAFTLLGLLSLIPVIYNKWRKHHA